MTTPKARTWPARVATLLALGILALVAAMGAQSHKPEQNSRAEATRLNNLGAATMGQQRFEEAAKMFARAAQLDPSLSAARLNEGVALLNAQRMQPARAALQAYAKDNPDDPRGWYNLGLLDKAQGNAKAALESFQHAARLAASDSDAQYLAGAMAAQLGEDQEAIASFERALKLNQYHASAEFGLARAYQHAGNQQQARAHLARFQELTRTKLGAPMSLAYGDQGPLSLAVVVRGQNASPGAPIKVQFNDVTRAVGLATSSASSQVASGACFFDYDGDGRPDLFVANQGGHPALYRNDGKGFTAAPESGIGGEAPAVSCAAADFDNDGRVDLAVGFADHLQLFHNEGDGKFKDVTEAAGLAAGMQQIAGLLWVDYDHDGDVDLYVTSTGRNLLWRNNGNRTFTDVTKDTNLGGAGSSAAVPSDLNNDRAVDLAVSGSTRVYLNPREGKWPSQAMNGNSRAIAILDFDHDGWMDIATTQDDGIALWRNVEGKSFEKVQMPQLGWSSGWGIVALDYDNDGWVDLAAVGETPSHRGEIRLLRNQGAKGFRDVSGETGLDKLQLAHPRSIVAADYDGDGDTDLLVTDSGAAHLLRNDGGNANNSVRLALKGTNDNKSAVGAKVEVFAGDLFQKMEVTGAAYLSQSVTDALIGLGERREADVVRLLWPTGVVQDEIQIASGKTKEIDELDRRASSCPVLFAWDGARYRFVSDMLGAGVVGHWVAPGQRNIPDPTEYVKIEPFSPAPRAGRLSFRLMEPMEEVVYLDQVRLLAVDHSAGMDVFPNERFLSKPPFPDFKVISSGGAQPARAWDDHGRDVSELLQARDHRYVSDLRLLPFKGFTEPHKLEIDLGEAYRGEPLRLLMYGYIEYFTATSMYAAAQAGITPVAPYVEAQDASGRWVRVLDDMGFPAGLPRTITVDLSGKLPVGTRRLRIVTNLQIYWDQILVDRTAGDGAVKVREVPLAGASLRFHGYPRAIEGSSPGDLSYVYEQVSRSGPYSHEIGAYTREGDVLPLLNSADDRFVVLGSGEEVAVDFDPSSLPALAAGWKRDYFFFADGYEKDMDFYAAEPLTVDPLPYHGMREYPPATNFPDDRKHTDYLLRFNTRFVGRTEPGSYRFDYPKRP